MELPGDISRREGGGGDVVNEDDIRKASGLEAAHWVSEEFRRNERVIPEEEVKRLHCGHAGVPVDELVDEAARSVLLEHIVRHAVRAEADEDALLEELEEAGDADGVVHVGLGVRDDHGLGLRDDVDLLVGQEDAVAHDGRGPQRPGVLQPLDARLPVLLLARLLVVLALGHVDVHAGVHPGVVLLERLDGLDGLLERLVAHGERGVGPKGGAEQGVGLGSALPHEADVLVDALLRTLEPVAVSHLVAQAGADAELGGGLGELVERARDVVGTRVVVHDAGGPRTETLDAVEKSAHVVGLGVEGAVKTPPKTLEYLEEARGWLVAGVHPAGVETVVVPVRANKAGDDEHPAGIDLLVAGGVLGEKVGGLANFENEIVLNGNRAVLDGLDGLAAESDNLTVVNKLDHRGKLSSFLLL